MVEVIEVQAGGWDAKSIVVPTSKSYANRLLVLAAKSPEDVIIKNLPQSTDVINFINCLKKIGLEIREQSDQQGRDSNICQLLVRGHFPACEESVDEQIIQLESGDGGTTNRFLLPLLALGRKNYRVVGAGPMQKRPMQEFLKWANTSGIQIKSLSKDFFPLDIKGPAQISIEHKNIEIDCSQTTQFLSGLNLAYFDEGITFSAINLKASEKYLELTYEVMRQFHDQKEKVFTVPVDFSSLSYPLALAVVSGSSVNVSNCYTMDPFQADSIFLSLLSQMGVRLSIDPQQGLFVQASSVRPEAFDFDAQLAPDLVPTLAFVAAYAQGPSQIRNMQILRYKESDRVAQVLFLLNQFGVTHLWDETSATLQVEGNSDLAPWVEYVVPHDHRMAMLAYLFMRKNQGGKIIGAQYVNKSFPLFFQVMGQIEVLN